MANELGYLVAIRRGPQTEDGLSGWKKHFPYSYR